MSRKNSLEAKKARRTKKLFRKELPAYIDLVDWIKIRQPMSTQLAMRIINLGWLKSDSHTLTDRYVPASLRGNIELHVPSK